MSSRERAGGADPCIGCHTNCCEYYVINVSAHDIYRIHHALGVPPAEFLELLTTSDTEAGAHIGDGFFELALRKQKDGAACVFLLSIGEARLCSIHAFKPGACAAYPFTLDADDNLRHRDQMLCPTTWTLNWREQQEARETIRRTRGEQRFHKSLIKRWNEEHDRGGGSLEEYVEYLLDGVAWAEGESRP